MQNTLKLRAFDPCKMNCHNVCIIGKRQTGTSTLIKDLLASKQISNSGVVLSPTFGCDSQHTMVYHLKQEIQNEFDVDKLDSFVSHQIARLKTKDGKAKTYFVSDECIADVKQYMDKYDSFKELVNYSRTLQVALIIALQYPEAAPMYLINVDCIFLFRCTNIGECRKIYEHYAPMFPSFEEFYQTFEQITQTPYTAMVIYNNTRSNKLEDQVFWYRGE